MSRSRQLRIAIDASAIPRQLAGAGVYTYQLIQSLAGATEHTLIVFARDNLFDDLVTEGQIHKIPIRTQSRPGRLAWEQMVLPVLLRRLNVDVLHSPHHHTPAATRLTPRRAKLVVTIHDLTFMHMPERYSFARRYYMEGVTRASALAADAIITPSQTVRRQVIARLGVRAERVVEIPEAATSAYHPASRDEVGDVRARYGLPPRYILSVGTLEPGKNRTRLLRAFAAIRARGIDTHLAIAGQRGWKNHTDYDLVRELGLSGTVSFLGYVPERDMPALYSGATVFAFPSLHEGFGLPVLESMASGTPVLTSAISATAEVADKAACLVDPRDTGAIAAALELLLRDEHVRDDLRERGFRRASHFSWERTARETLLLYELVANR